MTPVDAVVVDDDLLLLHLLVEHCLALGRRNVRNYHTAGDALSALRSGAGYTPDTLLILDLNMPRLDGLQMLRELQIARFPGRLLFVSGEGQRMLEAATRVARAMGLVVAGALEKPVTREAMKAALRAVPHVGTAPEPVPRKFSGDEVRAAIEKNELEVFYQPKVVVSSCSVAGFEALMRWRHPLYGVLGPGAFLETMEDEGILHIATRRLLRQVLVEMQQLAACGLRLPVAVNVAIQDLEQAGFCDDLMSMLKLYKTSPQDIHLEVTERGVGNDAVAALQCMSRLRLQRINLAVDDFGTGDASLLRLREFPFDYIKIDRSFVHGAASDRANRAIFDACSAMAFQLGLGVVAEGVESEDDWTFVRQRNCEQAQGYFIGRPMPLVDVRGWMQSWNERRFGLLERAA